MSDTCPRCNGKGTEPGGWSLKAARENPKAFNTHRLELEHGPGHGVTLLFGNDVVSPLMFKDGGIETCIKCKGSGLTSEAIKRRAEDEQNKREEYFKKLIGTDEMITCPKDHMIIMVVACFDDSDAMTDYYNNHKRICREYVLAIRKKGKRTEKLLRSIIAEIPEFKDQAWKWDKEDYSGGHGYWMQSKVIGEYPYACYSGKANARFWYEIQFNMYGEGKSYHKSKFFVEEKKQPEPVEAKTHSETNVDGVTIRRNLDKNGIEIIFPEKPADDILQFLKDNGFRFSRPGSLWWRKFDESILKIMEEYFSTSCAA